MQVKGFLIVRADSTMRVTKQRVRLGIDEVAFPTGGGIKTYFECPSCERTGFVRQDFKPGE